MEETVLTLGKFGLLNSRALSSITMAYFKNHGEAK